MLKFKILKCPTMNAQDDFGSLGIPDDAEHKDLRHAENYHDFLPLKSAIELGDARLHNRNYQKEPCTEPLNEGSKPSLAVMKSIRVKNASTLYEKETEPIRMTNAEYPL